MFTPLAVPDQHIRRTPRAVAGNDVVTGPIFQQIRLMRIAHDDEPKSLVGLFHAVHRFRHGTVGIVGPGGFGYGGDGRQGRSIQPATDRESLAGLFAVIEKIGLITGGVRTDCG